MDKEKLVIESKLQCPYCGRTFKCARCIEYRDLEKKVKELEKHTDFLLTARDGFKEQVTEMEEKVREIVKRWVALERTGDTEEYFKCGIVIMETANLISSKSPDKPKEEIQPGHPDYPVALGVIKGLKPIQDKPKDGDDNGP